VEGGIAVVVGEVEAGHGGGVAVFGTSGVWTGLRVTVCSFEGTHGVVERRMAMVWGWWFGAVGNARQC
jgi:hypothetical protein